MNVHQAYSKVLQAMAKLEITRGTNGNTNEIQVKETFQAFLHHDFHMVIFVTKNTTSGNGFLMCSFNRTDGYQRDVDAGKKGLFIKKVMETILKVTEGYPSKYVHFYSQGEHKTAFDILDNI